MPNGWVGPWRVALQRSRAEWLIVAATWLVVLSATTLLAVGVIYGDAVAATGLRRVLADQPARAANVAVTIRVPPDALADADAGVTAQLRRILGWTGGEIVRTLRSESFALPGQRPEEIHDLTVLAAYDGIAEHADLVEGAWPAPDGGSVQGAISRAAATELGVSVGDVLELTSRREGSAQLAVEITGIWRPQDPGAAYWLGDPLDLAGVVTGASFDTFGPIVVDRADLLAAVVTDAEASWRALPAFERLRVDHVRGMRSDVRALDDRLVAALGPRSYPDVTTDLDAILTGVERSLLVSRSGVLLLTIQFAVVAGYALVLVAGLLVEQRRIETALLRSRGATPLQVTLMAAIEGLVLVIPAVLLAPWLAVGLLEIFDRVGPLAGSGLELAPVVTLPAVLTTAAVGIGCILALAVPALAAGQTFAAVRQSLSRAGTRPLAQRLGLDLALVVVAGIGLWQLRSYGAPITRTVRGTLGLDPLLVAAPAIGLLAGAVLALRVVPGLAQLAQVGLARLRGLVAPLGARQLARRPLRYTRAALLLMLATALGTFAAAYGGTWTQSQRDQAGYAAGADVRVETGSFPDLPMWALGPAYGAIEGVEAALPVLRQRIDGGGATGELIGVDGERAGAVADSIGLRPDLSQRPLPDLMSELATARPAIELPAIPGTPESVRIVARVELTATAESEAPIPPSWPGVGMSLVVRDADGMVHRLTGGRLTAGGGVQHTDVGLEIEVPDAGRLRPAGPMEILGVELAVTLPQFAEAEGTMGIDAVQLPDGSRIETAGAWRLLRWDAGNAASTLGEADRQLTDPIRLGLDAAAGEQFVPGPTASTFALQPAGLAALEGRLRAVGGEALLAATGATVGGEIQIGSASRSRVLEVRAGASAFPTVDPDAAFAVVDAPTQALTEYAQTGQVLVATEWWLAVSGGSGEAVAAALAREPYSAEAVTVRDELAQAMLAEPIALGLLGALALGSVAAVVFAAIGFVMSAAVSARERLGEFALLRALGLSPGQLLAWLWVESTFLVGIGLLAGTGVGVLLAWVVLPFATLTAEGGTVVPPAAVVVPWPVIGILYLAAAGALLITVVVIAALLRRVQLGGVLRAAED